MIKSYVGASIYCSHSIQKDIEIDTFSGFYKGSSNGNDSLLIVIKIYTDNVLCKYGKKVLPETKETWKTFSLGLQTINNAIADRIEIEISINTENRTPSLTQYVIDELTFK